MNQYGFIDLNNVCSNIVSKDTFIEVLKEETQDYANDIITDEIEVRKVVLYDGNPDADIMVVARDLGKDEIRLDKPLIGQAGSLFRKTAAELGFVPTEDFFMCNTVPLKPVNNIAFSQDIRDNFKWVLDELVYIVNPKYILCLGKEAIESFLDIRFKYMKEVVGREFKMKLNGKDVFIYPSYHPSYILRLTRQGLSSTSNDMPYSLDTIRSRVSGNR